MIIETLDFPTLSPTTTMQNQHQSTIGKANTITTLKKNEIEIEECCILSNCLF